jgi:hypothetical protein
MKFAGKRVSNAAEMFNILFEMDRPTVHQSTTDYYGFLYWRKTPRGRVKFGITHLPFERLRMQQQGTDEEIQFDHIWMIRSCYKSGLKKVEDALKNNYQHLCLHRDTNRAGHTEWFKDINIEEFQTVLLRYANNYGVSLTKIELDDPYTATKSSECPFGAPSNSRHHDKSHIQGWQEKFWVKISVNENN